MKINRTRSFILAVLALLAVWAWANPIPSATAAGATRILPLGDSITQGDQQHGSYRRSLLQELALAGIQADFVGTVTNHFDGNVLNPDYDLDHEGHGGFKVEELLGGLPEWLSSYTPDVCLLHAGSNDIFQDQDNASTVTELGQIIDTLRADNPAVVVLLAKIIPRDNAVYSQRITNLNAQLNGLATAKSMPESPVILVDQNTGFNAATDTFDTIHPNAVGTEKMAQKWFDALQPLLSSSQPPRPPAALQAVSGNQQITLSWTAPLSATAFNVKLASTSGGSYSVIVSNLAATGYTNSGLVNGTTYYYVVTAISSQGESTNSMEISSTPSSGPVPLVRVAFDEPMGTTTPNLGSAGGLFTLTTPVPERTTNVPVIVGGSGAIDMGTSAGEYAVDSTAPLNALAGLDRFTLTGWLNNRSIVQGSGGNRILSCVDDGGDGFELIYKGDGSLILCVNQSPDSNSPRSSAGKIPEDYFAGADNWRFLAVTYDATSGQVRFYFGSNTSDATLDQNRSYTGRGPIGAGLGRLSIGHMNPATRSSFLSRMFRGMIDEVQIFGMVLSPSEIITVQRGGALAPSPPAANFSGTPTTGSAPLTVNFTDSSSGSITGRFWNFGDGANTNTTSTNVTHTYNTTGTNTVSLGVSGPGGSNTFTRNAYIVITNALTPPGLVGDWKLDDGSGNTATDSSGNGYHGTLVNGPLWTNGYCAGALNFDGVNDYAQVPSTQLLEFAGRSFTVALRVRSTRNGPQALVEKQNTGYSGEFLLALNRDNAVPGGVSVWTGNNWIDSNFRGATDGQWHHWAVTYDGSQFRLYRDGILDRTFTASAAYVVTGLPLIFGRFATGNTGWFFQGQMDEIRRYNRALSDAEIAALIPCANSSPVANFGGSPTGGTAPLMVAFTDSSTGSITSRFWDFGDGATTNTTATVLAHTYAGAGVYTVMLTVSGPGGSNTLTRPAYIATTNLPFLLTRVRNDTLRMPESLPVSGFTTTNTLGGLSFTYPVAITSPPGETNRLFIAEQGGLIFVITNLANPTKTVFLDLTNVVFGGTPQLQQGLSSIAFHPGYATNGYFYVVYVLVQRNVNANGYFDRLSRFQESPANPNQALREYELVLIDQFDEAESHNMDDLRFGADGYLYVSIGDEGDPADTFRNAQRIDKDFFSGILRLDVDKHPGNLQPNLHPASSTNYLVPADNPFVGATSFNGQPVNSNEVRTEFYAVGLRNPWRMAFDPVTGLLYCGDVGESSYEELNIIVKGGNYGWAYGEGTHPGVGAAEAPPGFSPVAPILEYAHGAGFAEGRSIIGGAVYRGNRLSQLQGAYIFADYASGNIWQLRYDGTAVTNWERLTFDKDIVSFGLDPRNGDILLCDVIEGKIKRLDYDPTPPGANTPPPTLADTGAFADLLNLTPNAGIVPYDINVHFWSDNALKRRWFSVPDLNQKIGFSPDSNWTFPTGTVWVKHFELQLTNGVPSSNKRLETRLLVKNTDGIYGVTYRWSNSLTNATLVPEEGFDESFVIRDGGTVRTQIWHYPSRSECQSCHTAVGGFALGVNTPQMNRPFTYGSGTTNQIQALSDIGYFQSPVSGLENMIALAAATNMAASLEHRARSYLFANCVYCHQPGASGGGVWDARITTPLSAAGIINGYLLNNGGNPINRVIKPGDSSHSMLLTRIASTLPTRMPPLATSVLDTNSINLINEWIGSLLRILPLGDSITQGDTSHDSYRRPLWQLLNSVGLQPDFVGSLSVNFGGPPPHPDFDLNHEGHWGLRADELLAQLPGWLAGYTPDVFLLHAGSNDAAQNQSTVSTVNELGQIIDRLRTANTNVTVLLAKLIPATDPSLNSRITDLNSQLDSLAASKSAGSSPVLVVDQNAGFNAATDTYDGVHPNTGGEQKMAQKWFDALQAILSGMAVPAPPTGLRVTVGNAQAALTWNASAAVTGYNVKRSTLSGANYLNIATNLVVTNYTDMGLANGVTYYYVVTAINEDGESQNSTQVSATPGGGPVPIVRISFDESGGTIATNRGSAGGTFTLTTPQPARTANVPAYVGGTGAIDMGISAGDYAVDSPSPISALIGLSRFTLTGWLNNRSGVQGPSGNRVVSCIDDGGDGFELIYKNDDSLIFTVNQGPDSDRPRSSAGMIPADFSAGAANWRFFAVTYDGTLEQVRFYFGSNTSDAALDVTKNYPGRGAIGPGLGRLSIGHMNPATRSANASRMFRGLIDEVRIYGTLLSSNEIVVVQRETISASGLPSVTNCPGTSVTFTPNISGAGPFTYQWTKDGSVIPDATNSTYTIPAVTSTNAATYCVRVNGPVDSVTNCTILNVLSPATASGPASQAACPGATTTLATAASGTGPFMFQWRKNGTLIPGATANLYTIQSVTAGDAGAYCVEVTGACNSVTNCATLTVLASTTATGPLSLTNCPGNPITFSTVAAGAGPFTYQWRRNGTNISGATNSTYIIPAVSSAAAGPYSVEVRGACNTVTNSVALTVFANTTATSLVSLTNCPATTVSFSAIASGSGPFTYRWLKNGGLISGATGSSYTIPAVSAADAGAYCLEVAGACNTVTNCATLTVLTNTTAIGPQSLTNCPGTPATFTTVASGTGPFGYQWAQNGTSIAGATNSSFTLAAMNMADAGGYCVKVTGACSSVTNCATLTVLTNVTATSLASLTNCPGTSATFSTVASGSGPFHYQWKKDGAPISGATNSSLSIASVSATDAGVYCVGVTGACTSVTNCATLTVLTPTTATALTSLTNCPNASALFATAASGTGPFSYQWRRNGAAIPGATNNSFAIPSATAADAGGYCVVVTGACNSVTNCATLTVLVNVSAIGPNSLTNCPGTTASFTTVASGTSDSSGFTYQWTRAGAAIPDATNASYTIPAVLAAAGVYCVEVTGACNSVTNCATLTVLTPASASSLVSLTNCPGSSAVFVTVPSGSPDLLGFRFQWRHSSVVIPGATNSSLSIANVSAADAGEYCVEVTGACNSVTNCATLTVLEATTATAFQSLTNCVNANATFGTVASGTGPFRYQWRHNGLPIPDGTNEAFTIAPIGIADAGAYCVEVNGTCNSVTNCATLTVYEPIVVSGPESLIRCPGTSATLTTEVTGTSPFICRWLHNGVPIPDATNSSLLIGPLSDVDAGTYCVEVTGACNNVTNCATLTVLTNTAATALSSLARCPGEEATFSTVASGSPDSSGFLFRWKHEGIAIPGATNSSLTLSSVSAADAGQYCVEVTGSCDSVTNCATLTVHQLATASGPAPLTNCPGTTAMFSVAAGGTGPIAYQWIKDGSLISNATNSTLILASVSHADAGLYTVQVRGFCSSVTNSAGLTVLINASASALTSLTNCPGSSATFQTVAEGTGPFRYLWRHNGTPVPAATNSSLTVPAVGAADEGEYCVEVTGACNSVTNCAWLEVLLSTVAAGPHSLTNCPGSSATFTAVATGSGVLTYQWKKDGAPITEATNTSFAIPSVTASDAGNYCVEISGTCGSVTNCATLTVLTPTAASNLESLTNCPGTSAMFATLPSGSPDLSGFRFQWRHDGIAILNATNSSLTIANVSAADAGEYCVEVAGACNSVTNCASLTVLEATTTTALQSLTNCPAANAMFTTVASGTGPFRYQWRHDGVMIPGATNETVSIASVVMADAGIYCVEVTGACNAVTNCAILTVLEPITMTGPLSLTNCPGTAAILSTVASGSGPLTYRWRKDGLTIAGATNSSLTIASVNAGDAGAYCVEVSGPCNSVTNCATLTVLESTTATSFASQTNCPGSSATFQTTASGTPDASGFRYRWTYQGAELPDATNSMLTLAAVTASNTGAYCVEVTGACNSVTNCAWLEVLVTTTAIGPDSLTNCPGEPAILTTVASGTPDLSGFHYQWKHNGALIPGATNNSFSVPAASSTDAGTYCVEVTGACGSVTNCASLNVLLPTTASSFASQIKCPGEPVSFSTIPSGSGPFRFRWTKDGAPIPGATNSTFGIPAVTAAEAGVYCAQVTGLCNSVTNCATLAVLVPTTAPGPFSQTNCPGTPATFATVASGTGPFAYRWLKDGTPIPDATNDTFAIATVIAADAGNYCVEVAGVCTSVTNCATLTVLVPVSAIGPASQTNCVGSAATFTTIPSGSPDLSGFHFEWTKDGASIPNATNSSYTIPVVALAHAGNYCVEVSGPCNSVTNCAVLTVHETTTASALMSLTNCPGTVAVFTTVASGTGPFTYQWGRNGAILPNATNETLSLAAVSAADAGIYCVEVTGACNTVTNCATLTVSELVTATGPASQTNCPGTSATFTVTPFGTGPFRYQWSKDGAIISNATNSSWLIANVNATDAGAYCVEVSGACSSVTNCATLTVLESTSATVLTSLTNCPGTSAQFSTVASGNGPFRYRWTHNGAPIPGVTNSILLISMVSAADAGEYCVEVTGVCNTVTNCAALAVLVPTTAAGPLSQTNCPGEPAMFATVASGTGPFHYQWKHNGALIPGATNNSFSIWAVGAADAGTFCVEVSGACNSVTNCATLTVLVPVTAIGPASQTNCPGTPVTFTTAASGSGPFSYQWRKNGATLTGATNSSFGLAAVTMADAGAYCVQVIGACGSVTNCAMLTVLTNVTATSLASLTNCPGTSATFSTVASGTAPFTYRWRHNGAVLPAATNDTLSLAALSAADAGIYCVEVTGSCNSLTNCGTLTMLTPTSASSLVSLTNCPSSSVVFATVPSGSPDWSGFRFQWRHSGVAIPGATNSSLSIANVSAANAGEYCVEVTGACNSLTQCATLTVLEATTATALPSLTNCPGTSAQFSTVASGTGPFHDRWTHNGAVIPGATNSTFSIPAVTGADAGSYCVEVTGACNIVTNCATLTVHEPTVASGPALQTNCIGTTATFMTLAGGTGQFYYQWSKDGTPIPGATNSTLSIGAVTAADAGLYCVEVSGLCNSVTNCATLTVLTNTTATSLTSLTNCPGASAVFSTVASGAGPFTYRWRKNGGLISNATNNSFTIASVGPGDAGSYCVEVIGACNTITNCASLTVLTPTTASGPQSLTNCPGTSATLTTVASGTAPFLFQWTKNGAPIPDATNNAWVIPAVTAADAGTYCVQVTGTCGRVTNCATITVLVPADASSLTSLTNCPGTSALFATLPSGSGPFRYRWLKNGALIASTTNSSFVIPVVTTGDAGEYCVEVNGACGSVTNCATLTVLESTSATALRSLTNCPGASATFSTVASGTPPFSFRWMKNGTLVSGATNSSFTIPAISATNAETYCLEVAGACGSVTNCGTLTVKPSTSATALSDVTKVVGESVTFSTVPSGTGPFSFSWFKDGASIAGAEASSLALTSLTLNDSGLYCVRVAGGCGSVTNCAQLTVQPLSYTVTTLASPAGAGSTSGDGTYTNFATVTVVATTNPGFAFTNWTESGTVVSTSASYLFTLTTNRALVANFFSTGPIPIVHLPFNENSGNNAVNLGSAGGTLSFTPVRPVWGTNVPLNVGAASAVNFGATTGDYGVDSMAPIGQLGGLTKFSITGWVNNRDVAQGSGGNRLVSWLGLDNKGAELVYRGDGSLILSVNEEPSNAQSSTGMIPADFEARPANWRFFAVTYDATTQRVLFYFGSNTSDAILDKSVPYTGRGAVGAATARLTVGHLNPERRPGRLNRMFRGLIDEVQIFGSALTLSEIINVQRQTFGPPPPPPPAPVTNFSGAPTTGAVPLMVSFTDSSTGSITSRFWTFGDGDTTNTTSTSVTHTYNGSGTNTVSLLVNGPGGSNLFTRLAYIAVTNAPPPPPPMPNFSALPTNGSAPFMVNFTDSSTGSITSRFWTFGDGSTTNTTSTSVTHTYAGPGTNTVSLTVTGPGGSNTFTRPGYIVVTNAANTPEFVGHWKLDEDSGTTAADSSGHGHHGVLVNGPVWTNGYCAGALSFDGVNDYLQVPSTALLEFGGRSFTMALRVKSIRSGPQALVEKQNTGFNGFFLLALNRDNAVPGGVSVWTGNSWIDSNFRGLTDGQWHHLAVTYDGGTFRLYYDGILDKAMAASAPYAVTQLPLNFGRSITGNIGWFFQGQMDEIRRYNRALSGSEIAALTPCANAPPVAQFSGNPTAGYAPLMVSFTDSSTGSITNRFWSFGDGTTTTTTASSVTRLYNQPGTNTVSLTVNGPGGTNMLTRAAYIVVTNPPPPPPPVANFTAGPTSGPAPLMVFFTNQSLNATSFLWNFGDGKTSTAVHPTNTYTNTGLYTISLSATGPGGTTNLTRTDSITVTSPPPRNLTVLSLNPSNGVPITVSPADTNGLSNGTTPFICVYLNNVSVTLTAPSTASTNTFQRWERNGVALGTNRTVSVTLDGDSTLLARYESASGGGVGLIGHWKLDDGSGSTAIDSSGLGYHGTLLNGPTWTNGQCSGALNFDGVNDYMRVPDADVLDFAKTNFTLGLWVRTTRTSAQALVEKQHTVFDGFFLMALNRDSVVPGGFSIWTGSDWIDSNFRGVTDGQWHHLAMTFNGTAFRLYRDGTLDLTKSGLAYYANTSLPLNFGRSVTGNIGWYFRGQMDEIRRYNRALSDVEIAGLIQCPPGGSVMLASALRRTAPALRLESLRHDDGTFRLVIRHADGTPLAPERMKRLELYATTDFPLPVTNWTKLNTRPVWVDGAAQWDDLESVHLTQRFYILRETP